MSVKLEDIRTEIYSEKLPENWWDGRFNTMSVGVTEKAFIESVSREPFRRKLVAGLGLSDVQGRFEFSELCLSSFQTIQDGEFVSHPFFQIETVSASAKRRLADSRMDILKLYFDARGYGVRIDGNEVTYFSPLMLRPFQGQTGYCVGGLKRVMAAGRAGEILDVRVSLVSTEKLLEKTDWRCLLRFAKPYDDYLAAAGVEEVECRHFRHSVCGYYAVPLYIGSRCVGARLPLKTQNDEFGPGLKYVSYETYLKYFF